MSKSVGVYHEIEDAIRQVAMSKGMDLASIYGDSPELKDRNCRPKHGPQIQPRRKPQLSLPMYMAPGVDLTEEVVKRLNEKYEKPADTDGKRGSSKKD